MSYYPDARKEFAPESKKFDHLREALRYYEDPKNWGGMTGNSLRVHTQNAWDIAAKALKDDEAGEEAAPDFTDLGDFEAVALMLIPDLVHEATNGIHWKRMKSRFLDKGRFAGVDSMAAGVWLENLEMIRDRLNESYPEPKDAPDTPSEDVDTAPTRLQQDFRTFLAVGKSLNLPAYTLSHCINLVRGRLKDLEAEARCDGTPHPDDDQNDDPKPSPVAKAAKAARLAREDNARKSNEPKDWGVKVLDDHILITIPGIVGKKERDYVIARWREALRKLPTIEWPADDEEFKMTPEQTRAPRGENFNEFLAKKGYKVLSQKETED